MPVNAQSRQKQEAARRLAAEKKKYRDANPAPAMEFCLDDCPNCGAPCVPGGYCLDCGQLRRSSKRSTEAPHVDTCGRMRSGKLFGRRLAEGFAESEGHNNG